MQLSCPYCFQELRGGPYLRVVHTYDPAGQPEWRTRLETASDSGWRDPQVHDCPVPTAVFG